MKRILLIEDDAAIRSGLINALTTEHFEVRSTADGEEGYRLARSETFDAIVLDIMLPNRNGDDICRSLRRDGIDTPVIMLTARGDEIDRVMGLELGADDYVTKPFSIRELVARIRTVLRRGREGVLEIEEFSFGNIHLDFKKHEARTGSTPVRLTALEFKVLKYLIEHESQVVTRTMLLDDVWGYDAFPTTRTVDTLILSLRKKIEQHPAEPQHLLTVQGVGYRFVRQTSAVDPAAS